LSGQILAAYMIGRQEQLKILLSQSDPASLGRMLTYYGYFGRSRAAQIDAIRGRQQQLQTVGQQIDEESSRLRALQDDDQRALADLSHARTERAQALAAVSREVKSHDQELADLKRQEQAVQALLADLARLLEDFPTDKNQDFNQLRGRLPWPVAGRLVARGHDSQNGVLIDAAKGALVRAPYFGRVVYADWLQGLGTLLIIGHSGGYMSLYGHVEVLYKSVGDTVAPGDVIASLDDAEGKPAQLYFEIRQGRKPLDPRAWLKTAQPPP
jgi:septal ring factor EnvC (AmiA/AmiB activator)